MFAYLSAASSVCAANHTKTELLSHFSMPRSTQILIFYLLMERYFKALRVVLVTNSFAVRVLGILWAF